jgi:twitching motility protein PilT
MHIHDLLQAMMDLNSSDLHIKSGRPPLVRVQGTLQVLDQFPALTEEMVVELCKQALNEHQREKFDTKNEIDAAYNWPGKARFRCAIFRQRSTTIMVMRVIPNVIPNLDDLDLPPVLKQIALTERGLVLVTGATGAGKSTTLAALVNEINLHMCNHIVTVEDPIEFVHPDKKSSVCQREVGLDTETFASALRYLLRQDPDVILIGEMRDTETVRAAITAAETGHMVFSTLHTIDSIQTIDRILDFFPSAQQGQIRSQLSTALKAVISQRLVLRADGKGRIAAQEIMVCTPTIRSLIADNKINQIRTFIKDGAQEGMQSFDQSLVALFKSGVITKEEAVVNSTSPAEIELAFKGIASSKSSAQSIMAQMANEQSRVVAVQSMERGTSFFRRQMWAEATLEFKKVLSEDPGNEQAKIYLKEIQDQAAKAGSVTEVKTVVARGLSLFQEDKVQEAMAQWNEALKSDPDNAQAKAYLKGAQERLAALEKTRGYTQQGVQAYQSGDLLGAIKAWEEALKADSRNEQAELYLQEGRKRLKEMEDDREAKQHFVQGAAAYQSGDLLDAVMEWNEALRIKPDYPEAKEYASEAGKLLESQGLENFDAAAPDAGPILTFYRAGLKEYVNGRFQAACVEFKKAQEKRPTHAGLLAVIERSKNQLKAHLAFCHQHAERAAAEGRLADAMGYLRTAVNHDAQDLVIKKAIADLKPKVDQAASALYSEAVNNIQSNRLKEAIPMLERVLELDPDHETAKRRLEDTRQKYAKLKEILSQAK